MKLFEGRGIDYYIEDHLLFHVDKMTISACDKIGLIGSNGSGKTTLLQLIKNRNLFPDNLRYKPSVKIASFDQIEEYNGIKVNDIFSKISSEVNSLEKEIYDLCEKMSDKSDNDLLKAYARAVDRFESVGGYEIYRKIDHFINFFGMSSYLNRNFDELSGGEKQYVRLAKTLFGDSDILLLDEPFNYLDKSHSDWLFKELLETKKAILLVSHNFETYPTLCKKIWSIENNNLFVYHGDYNFYLKEKPQRAARQEQKNRCIHNQLNVITNSMEKVRVWRDSSAEPERHAILLKRLEKKKEGLKSKIEFLEAEKNFTFTHNQEVDKEKKTGLIFRDLSVYYGDRIIFENIELTIKKGEHILLIGENGVGKTSLLRAIFEQAQYKYGREYMVYLQEQIPLFEASVKTVSDYLKEHMIFSLEKQEELVDMYFQEKNFLERFVKGLSVGEKRRLQISSAIMSEYKQLPKLFLMDEPTTHLDSYTQKKYLEWMNATTNQLIITSHEPSIIDSFCGTIYLLEKNCTGRAETCLLKL